MAKKKKAEPKERVKKGLETLSEWFKKQKPSDITDLVLIGLTTYAGWKTAENLGVKDIPQKLTAAGVGLLGYKLATTMGGTPPASQIAGLGILASIGLIAIGPDIVGALAPPYSKKPDVDPSLNCRWVQRYPSGRWEEICG